MAPPGTSGKEAERQAAVDRVLADPPIVHYMSIEDMQGGELSGVWSTEESCYRFLASRCSNGCSTLETGLGISTVLFAAWGASHRCVTAGQEEVDALVAYCRSRGIATEGLTFDVAPSDQVLGRLAIHGPALDIMLIDGCHGFPTPMIDWYFGASRLRCGGTLVVDDLQLPAVGLLAGFLDEDPRWRQLAGDRKWVAYERLSDGPLLEDWFMQPFYTGGTRPESPAVLARRVAAHIPGAFWVARQIRHQASRSQSRSASRNP